LSFWLFISNKNEPRKTSSSSFSSGKDDYKCDFCDKDFISKYSLNTHQKTAKYCLEKQGLISSFKCTDCNKTFGNKLRMNEHILICKKSKEKYTDDIKKQYEDIKKQNDEYKNKLLEKEIQIKYMKTMLEEMKEFIYGKIPLTIKERIETVL